jgi:hypothetical protein
MEPGRPRTRWWMPVAAAVMAATGIGVAAPEIVTGTFSSVGTFLRVLALVAALVGWGLLCRRFVSPRVRPIATWVPIAVVGALVLWPYFRPARTVDEAFPAVAVVETTADVTDMSAATTSISLPSSSTSSPTVIPRTDEPPPTLPATTVPPTTAPAEPVLLGSGTFQGLTGHRGRGAASISEASLTPSGSTPSRPSEGIRTTRCLKMWNSQASGQCLCGARPLLWKSPTRR